MSIVIDDINSNIEFGVSIFKSMLTGKIRDLVSSKFVGRDDSKLSLQECEDVIEAAYNQCLDFVHAEVQTLRNIKMF